MRPQVPTGLPTGLSENEKKLWLAIYVKARELLLSGQSTAVREAAEKALRAVVTERHSLEFRFGVKWLHSVKACLSMRQDFRGTDNYM